MPRKLVQLCGVPKGVFILANRVGWLQENTPKSKQWIVCDVHGFSYYYTGCEELPSHGAGDNPGGTCGVTCEVVCSSQFCGVLISLYIYTLFPFQCYILIGFLISMPFFYDFDRFYLFRCYFSRILIGFFFNILFLWFCYLFLFQYYISLLLLPFLI